MIKRTPLLAKGNLILIIAQHADWAHGAARRLLQRRAGPCTCTVRCAYGAPGYNTSVCTILWYIILYHKGRNPNMFPVLILQIGLSLRSRARRGSRRHSLRVVAGPTPSCSQRGAAKATSSVTAAGRGTRSRLYTACACEGDGRNLELGERASGIGIRI